MGMFKSKKSDLAAGPDVPIDQVMAMKSQGYSNNQIIQTLQRDGYTSSQIFDAISQSEMAPSPSTSVNPMQNPMQGPGIPEMALGQAPQSNQDSQFGLVHPILTQTPMQQYESAATTEEMIEAIIDEKWNELVRDINKVIEWKQKADIKLSNMEQQMNDLKDQFDKLHQAIIGKIGDYDKHMLDVGAELQAMEKVFSKVLPTFVDNVTELNRITDKMKTTTPVAKPKMMKNNK